MNILKGFIFFVGSTMGGTIVVTIFNAIFALFRSTIKKQFQDFHLTKTFVSVSLKNKYEQHLDLNYKYIQNIPISCIYSNIER